VGIFLKEMMISFKEEGRKEEGKEEINQGMGKNGNFRRILIS
jgi:hypothetical protein